jgi:hypothetical protein
LYGGSFPRHIGRIVDCMAVSLLRSFVLFEVYHLIVTSFVSFKFFFFKLSRKESHTKTGQRRLHGQWASHTIAAKAAHNLPHGQTQTMWA